MIKTGWLRFNASGLLIMKAVWPRCIASVSATHPEEAVLDHVAAELVEEVLEREHRDPHDLLLGAALGDVDELRDDARGADGGLRRLVEGQQPDCEDGLVYQLEGRKEVISGEEAGISSRSERDKRTDGGLSRLEPARGRSAATLRGWPRIPAAMKEGSSHKRREMVISRRPGPARGR